MEFENSTEVIEPQSGEQAGAVALQEQSPDTEGQAGVVAPQQSDFAMVDVDSGEGGTSETGDGNAARPAGRDSKADEADDGSVPDSASASDGAGQDDGTQRQSREENAAIRAARLRARREAEAEAARVMDERIARAGIPNPSNDNKPFASMKEWEEYGAALKRAEIAQQAQKTGRSVAELEEDAANRAFLSEMRRNAERQKANEAAVQMETARQNTFFADDVRNFVTKFPNFGAKELQALENNKQFRQFCGSRFGREPLAQLYGDYVALVGNAGAAAVERAAGKAAKSTGGGTAGGAVLSPSQKQVLDRWNEEHPEMAMSAKEFLGR